ncbi:uncharacterized protein PAC_02732 [Phialocephala subalpina]|uniref:Uncharacterized protein n=1 Tax=Phialocephala subalpina TaxID=576137 RepID=A0A1L7WJ97_9HELO|nr:uncharacterized protein PAC_02732 [Phialocephala subalpina]
MYLNNLLVLLALTRLGSGICAGYNYAFFSLPTSGSSRWVVTDDACNAPFPACGNRYTPCHCQGLHCSSIPIHVDSVEINGLWYACRVDSTAWSCENIYWPEGPLRSNGGPFFDVEQCCRNDGRRNLKEGRINEREFQAIEATNALLDIHKRDYADALASGMSGGNLTSLRNVQRRELKEAEKWQLMTRLA